MISFAQKGLAESPQNTVYAVYKVVLPTCLLTCLMLFCIRQNMHTVAVMVDNVQSCLMRCLQGRMEWKLNLSC